MTTTAVHNPTLMSRLRDLLGKHEPEIPDLFPYSLRDPLLSVVERSFYQVLLSVVGARVVICPKIRLADVFKVRATKDNKAFYNRIAYRRVDFLLCERYTLKPLLAIELYDHNQPRSLRKKRDSYMDKVFKAGKLPILHLVAQARYNLKALALRVAPYLTTVVYSRTAEPINFAPPPRCPHCHTPMVKRTVISGEYKGQEYYSCRNFPECGQRKPVAKQRSVAYAN